MKTDTVAKQTSWMVTWLGYALAAVLVLMPFHAFLTVAIGDVVGGYEGIRLWKEVILLAMLPAAIVLLWKTPGLWRQLRSGWLLWCLAAYVALHVGLGLVALAKDQVNGYALAYALAINLRFILIFLIALIVASRWQWLHEHWSKVLLWPAMVVVGFGLLQLFALPIDFLQRFGYGLGTIMPYETVDQKLDYIRIQSTLRGANPLGAYMVVVLSALAVILLRDFRDKRQILGVTFFSAGLIVLMATYSRSAYIGALIAILLAVWLVLHGRAARRRLAIGLVALALVGAGALLVFRDNDRLQNTFFHTDENSTSPMSSNEARSSALQNGVDDVLEEPFGRGPGTAGPASQHNVQPERIAENYYLQIGQETGWLGMGLFVAINALVARGLWRRRQDGLARLLLASLAGIAFIGLLQHVWADDTLALVWWGLAGVAMSSAVAPAILAKKPAVTAATLKETEPTHAKQAPRRQQKQPRRQSQG